MNINRSILTLEEFRKQELRFLPQATGELSNLLRDIALAAKRVNVEVNKAGLEDILGETGKTNVQGEGVKKLDEFANATFMAVLQRGISCAGIASEELDDFACFDEELCNQSKYVVVLDPLDGSSNIDVNISIGTIFGVYRRMTEKGSPCHREDFLQKGEKPGCCRIYYLWIIHDAGICNTKGSKRIYPGSFHRGIYHEPSGYQMPAGPEIFILSTTEIIMGIMKK